MGFVSDFRKGYRDGQNGKYNTLTVFVLVVVALYFIQEWTGLPVFDWAKSAVAWVYNGIMSFLEK
ncbi:MAG: hypothetical protein IKA00_05600 [Prevotella sp.]|nr:hypothetical protein [Prevotella sp.]